MSTEIIDEILDEFDFETVHRAMTALKWHWYGVDGVPSIGHLRRRARELLNDLQKHDSCLVGSGGFFAYRDEHTMGLRFEITNFEVEKGPT